MQNQYTDIYKKLSNSKLLEIIENRRDYESLAVATARFELEQRALSKEDISSANEELALKKRAEESRKELKSQRKREVKDKAFKFLEYLDPLIEKSPTKSILMTCVLLLLITIYKTVSYWSLIIYLFETDGVWGLILDLDFLEIVYSYIMLFFVWRTTWTGWKMLFGWLCLRIIYAAIFCYYAYQFIEIDESFKRFSSAPNLMTSIFILLFFSGMLYLINTRRIKELFKKMDSEDTDAESQES